MIYLDKLVAVYERYYGSHSDYTCSIQLLSQDAINIQSSMTSLCFFLWPLGLLLPPVDGGVLLLVDVSYAIVLGHDKAS